MMLSLFLFACNSSEEYAIDENTLDFYEEIQPILEQNCTSCHLESGQGIGDFTVYENVKIMAPLIQSSLENGTMPPPAADPTCREYKGSEALHLDEDKKEMIIQWIEEGVQEGDPANAQTYDRSAFKLSEPDLTVQIEEPYTPTFSLENNPANEYRCFSIKHNREEPFYITAIHPIVDNTDLVHHIVIAKGDEDGIIRNSDRPEGAGCIRNGGAFIRDFEHGSMLSGWAPGMRPVELADDTGMLILPDDYIIVQIHYYQNPDAERDSDQTSVAFRTTDDVEHVIQMFPMGLRNFTIPAGEDAYTITDDIAIPIGYTIWGIFPHMHVLGSAYSVFAEHDGEETCLTQSDRYSFENQLAYMFEDEFRMEANHKLRLSCTWNNSESNPLLIHNPPTDVSYGERTDEEMCYAFVLASF